MMGKILDFFRGAVPPQPLPPPRQAAAAPPRRPRPPAQTAASAGKPVLVRDDFDGDDVYGQGYVFEGKGPTYAPSGMYLCKVAGTTYDGREKPLQLKAFDPLSAVRLVTDFDNKSDKNAIAVVDASGRHQIGWLERDVAAKVAPRIRKGEQIGAMVLFEWRRHEDRKRCGLRLLLAPAGDFHVTVKD